MKSFYRGTVFYGTPTIDLSVGNHVARLSSPLEYATLFDTTTGRYNIDCLTCSPALSSAAPERTIHGHGHKQTCDQSSSHFSRHGPSVMHFTGAHGMDSTAKGRTGSVTDQVNLELFATSYVHTYIQCTTRTVVKWNRSLFYYYYWKEV